MFLNKLNKTNQEIENVFETVKNKNDYLKTNKTIFKKQEGKEKNNLSLKSPIPSWDQDDNVLITKHDNNNVLHFELMQLDMFTSKSKGY